MGEHPSRDLLARFMRGRLLASETRSVLSHLLAGCDACRQTTAALWNLRAAAEAVAPAPEDEHADAAYDRVLERVFRQVQHRDVLLQRQAAVAREAYEELARHPFPHQLVLVGESPRFRTRSFCELLLERSHEAGFQLPKRAIDLAQLAVAIAHQLADDDTPIEIVRGLQARSWAQLGNARRVSGDHSGAEQAFESAQGALAAEPRILALDVARVLEQLASLRRDQGRYGEAFSLLDRLLAIYRRLGQWHLLGRALAQKSMVCDEVGDLETELALLRQALDLLDPQADPRVFLAARHNLILALSQSGRDREAAALLYHTRPLYLEAGDRINLIRLRWLEGVVARGLGRIDRAEAAFREVRDSWVELGLSYDAALAALDLAGIYALQSRPSDMRRLAEEVLVIFQSLSIHREALAALLMFHRAAMMDEVGTKLVDDLNRFLRRSRNNPVLHYPRSA